jgi:signal transduction histidine kinase
VTSGWHRLSLRARLMAIGLLGLAVSLAVGSVALYTVLTVVGYRTIDDSGRATAAEVAGLLTEKRLPDPIPVTGSQIVQVVDTRNRVVSASVNADRLVPLLSPSELTSAISNDPPEVSGSRVGLASPLRVLAVRTGSGTAARTVVVAQQVDELRRSQQILRVTLLATYPLLLAVLGLIAWRVVGAALRPVEALRSSADRISGRAQDARLPVPASRDEISALAVTLNSMLDRLADSRARQRSFVADAAHELRSPLASMRTQLEVAERLGEGSGVSADLRAEVARMSDLVEDLLVLARLDADAAPPRAAEPVAVDALLEEVLDYYPQVRLAAPRAELSALTVVGQPDELRRAVRNLVDNAVHHAGRVVEVSARRSGGEVLVEVCDDGAGIPPEERERVFERFTRLDEGRARDAGGSGLGLAIVRELVRRNGGEVGLGDAPAGGLRATLRLPGG